MVDKYLSWFFKFSKCSSDEMSSLPFPTWFFGEFLCGPRRFQLVCCLKCRRHNVMINEEENFAATNPQEQEILRDEILAAVDPLSAAAAGPSSAIGPPSAVAAAPGASIGHPCSAAANQTISKAALSKLNYLRACLVRQLYFHAIFPWYVYPKVGLKRKVAFSHFCENLFCKHLLAKNMRNL
jgi:hypothetical protein